MASETPPPTLTEEPVAPETPVKLDSPASAEAPSTPKPTADLAKDGVPAGKSDSETAEPKLVTEETSETTPQKVGVPEGTATPEPGATPPWREKAGVILNQSSSKIAEAASKAGIAVAGAAEVTGTKVKATWETTKEGWQTNVQPRVNSAWQSTRDGWQQNVQPKMDAAARAAAETGTKIKQGFLQTRQKVASAAVHKRVAEATKNSFERSRSFLVKMEILPPELNPRAVFGVPLEKVVSYKVSPKPVPHIVIACTEFIENEGMSTEYLFDDEGDPLMITRLMKTYERDDQSNIPPGYTSRDVAQLLLAFFRCLPEPVLTYKLYDDIVALGGGDALRLKELLGSLPDANTATLECVFDLLSRIAEEAELTKMDPESLAVEWAPVLLWKKGLAPATTSALPSGAKAEVPSPHQDPVDGSLLPTEEKVEEESAPATPDQISEDAESETSSISSDPEDKDVKEQKAVIQAVKCMIEHYDVVFKEQPAEIVQE